MRMAQLCVAAALIFVGLFASAQVVYPQEQKSNSPELELLPVKGEHQHVGRSGRQHYRASR